MYPDQQSQLLGELKHGLTGLLGGQFAGLYLFGSRARREERADSDVDVLVVLRGGFDYGDLIRRTSALASELSLKYDTVVSRAFVAEDRFAAETSPFLMNVRREAVAV